MLNNYTLNTVVFNGRVSVMKQGLFVDMIKNYISKIGVFVYSLWNYISKIGAYGFDIRNYISKVGSFVFFIRTSISKIGLYDYLLEGIKNATSVIKNEFKIKFRVREK
jgi:hypothetical protein